ncbi:hypothetical protein O974_27130 [Mycobacterium avium 11-0986]|nr:hypothetical protein O974_27130 [Mycobacterium avium 11-0986]
MARSTSSKAQFIPDETRRRIPRFVSEKFLWTSQSQSTWSMIARVAAHFSASPGSCGRGPSAITRSFSGLAALIISKARLAVSVLLKMMKMTGGVVVTVLSLPRLCGNQPIQGGFAYEG